MTVYAYLRVSTLEQNTEKNKLNILKFANDKKLGNVEFIEEQISGRLHFRKRKLGELIDKMKRGDVLIVPELSRLARSITQILDIINTTRQNEIVLYSLKEGFANDSHSLTSVVTSTIFALVAQIERDLISIRTKEALKARQAKGLRVGRPKGRGKSKLDKYEDEIAKLLSLHVPKTIIAKQYGTSVPNLYRFVKNLSKNHKLHEKLSTIIQNQI